VIVARCERKSWGRGYTLYLEELPVPESQSLEATVALINRAMETTIRQSPQQYLWGYGRYKQPREDKQLSGEKA
ncbi:MAG: lysophospholipid acyltransferase family protein, partial [Comamonas sp.]|nr:lysophospholipid acyltransferase family protein [Comamonas sp.]